MPNQAAETQAGFDFGQNWAEYAKDITAGDIVQSTAAVQEITQLQDLTGKTVLDIGCGSGLHSFAAYRLGAAFVTSIDCDPQCFETAYRLRTKFAGADSNWRVWCKSLFDWPMGVTYDVVYAWGSLHHTGRMWDAIAKACDLTSPGGLLALSIYNDQGHWSRRWAKLKAAYCAGGKLRRAAILAFVFAVCWGPAVLRDCLRLRPMASWRAYNERGMHPWTDLVDWAGGFPFEVATPEAVFDAVTTKGFTLTRLKTCGGGLGCNEFTFRKDR